jgi:hypothetical protein
MSKILKSKGNHNANVFMLVVCNVVCDYVKDIKIERKPQLAVVDVPYGIVVCDYVKDIKIERKPQHESKYSTKFLVVCDYVKDIKIERKPQQHLHTPLGWWSCLRLCQRY